MRDCVVCDRLGCGEGIELKGTTRIPYLVAIFEQAPEIPGHIIIVPRRHVISLAELGLSDSELAGFFGPAFDIILNTDVKSLYSSFFHTKTMSSNLREKQHKMFHSPYLGKIPGGYSMRINDSIVADNLFYV
jgi:hypothetical protein